MVECENASCLSAFASQRKGVRRILSLVGAGLSGLRLFLKMISLEATTPIHAPHQLHAGGYCRASVLFRINQPLHMIQRYQLHSICSLSVTCDVTSQRHDSNFIIAASAHFLIDYLTTLLRSARTGHDYPRKHQRPNVRGVGTDVAHLRISVLRAD